MVELNVRSFTNCFGVKSNNQGLNFGLFYKYSEFFYPKITENITNYIVY